MRYKNEPRGLPIYPKWWKEKVLNKEIWDNMRKVNTYWYLASPYSKFPDGIEAAFRDVCQATAHLVARKVPVYSPIAHTHPVAIHGGLDPLDHTIWLPADQPLIDAASGMIVYMMPTWKDSYGVKFEIEEFTKKSLPIVYMSYQGFEMNDYDYD